MTIYNPYFLLHNHILLWKWRCLQKTRPQYLINCLSYSHFKFEKKTSIYFVENFEKSYSLRKIAVRLKGCKKQTSWGWAVPSSVLAGVSVAYSSLVVWQQKLYTSLWLAGLNDWLNKKQGWTQFSWLELGWAWFWLNCIEYMLRYCQKITIPVWSGRVGRVRSGGWIIWK